MRTFALAIVGSLLLTSWSEAQPLRIENLGLAGGVPYGVPYVYDRSSAISDSRAALVVSEREQGGRDLNGDGDAYDLVAFVYERHRNTVTNLGVAVTTHGLYGRFAIMTVDESSQGTRDLNGDGDTFDRVVHVYDTQTGVMRNLGKAGLYEVADGWLGVLDARGQIVQTALYLYNLATGEEVLVARNIGHFHLGIGLLTYLSPDVDADGRPHFVIYDLATRQASHTDLKATAQDAVLGDHLAAFTAHEAFAHQDWNGDGDVVDAILFVYDGTTQVLKHLGLAAHSEISSPLVRVDGRLVAWLVPEPQQGGRDLNGDGDALDDVVFVYDADRAEPVNMAREYSTSYGLNVQVRSGRVAFLADGYQMFVAEPTLGRLSRLASSVRDFTLGDSLLVFPVSEEHRVDLSGDGDPFDYALFVYDAVASELRNLQLETYPGMYTVWGEKVAFLVDENSHGGSDLNGDGAVAQRVVFFFDGKKTINLRSASFDTPLVKEDLVVFTANEGGQRVDLNGDGDTYDNVLQVVRLPGKPGRPR